MAFSELDIPAVAAALGRVATAGGGLLDGYFERRETLEIPCAGDVATETVVGPVPLLQREEGFAIRLLQGSRSWLASRDAVDESHFGNALRQVARSMPVVEQRLSRLALGDWPVAPDPRPLLEVPRQLERRLRELRVGFPLRLRVFQHRRWVQVVGERLAPAPQAERFFSLAAEHPAGRFGTLLAELSPAALDPVAEELAEQFRARSASPPDPRRGGEVVVLAPAATAVFLHEAVSHSLEADTLALTGAPDAAIGVRLGTEMLNLLDDPGSAPAEAKRQTDDEGLPVLRRWLLRQGVIEQPLADRQWASETGALEPGAAWRGDRHLPPGPRSMYLDLLPGDEASEALLEGEGLYVSAVARGRLDPLAGTVTLQVAHARRFHQGRTGDPVGPFTVQGTVSSLLGSIAAVGSERCAAGAGWCAKGGQKLPVWAIAPGLRLEGVEVLT